MPCLLYTPLDSLPTDIIGFASRVSLPETSKTALITIGYLALLYICYDSEATGDRPFELLGAICGSQISGAKLSGSIISYRSRRAICVVPRPVLPWNSRLQYRELMVSCNAFLERLASGLVSWLYVNRRFAHDFFTSADASFTPLSKAGF